MKSGGYVYIMTSDKMGTLYIGSTTNLLHRTWQHKEKWFNDSFTARYNVNRLVYYEWHESLEIMVQRERQLKKWNRNWKIRLIIEKNPEWKDLYEQLMNE